MEDTFNLVAEFGSWREVRRVVKLHERSLKKYIARRLESLWERAKRISVGDKVLVRSSRSGITHVGEVIQKEEDFTVVRRCHSGRINQLDYIYDRRSVPCSSSIYKIP